MVCTCTKDHVHKSMGNTKSLEKVLSGKMDQKWSKKEKQVIFASNVISWMHIILRIKMNVNL